MKVLKFGAFWCPGCLVMRPRWQQIEALYPNLSTEYYEYDEAEDVALKWEVGNKLPVFIFVDQNDQELERLKGEPTKEEIIQLIEKYKDR